MVAVIGAKIIVTLAATIWVGLLAALIGHVLRPRR